METIHEEDAKLEMSKSKEPKKQEDVEITSEESDQNIPDVEELQTELESQKSEIESLKSSNLRLAAEMDNLRKRHAREGADLRKFSNEKMLQDMLPVLDSFDKAIGEQGVSGENRKEDSEESFFKGFSMVQKQLLACLKKHGLEMIDADILI